MWRVVTAAAAARAGWIDPATPKNARSVLGYGSDGAHDLVFSDEFEEPGRTFRDGEDPRWTAVHKNDYTNKALQYYHEEHAVTSNGFLNITTTAEDTLFDSHQVKHKKKIHVRVRKHYRSGMLQGWNKFCFTGGVLEIAAQLPGRWDVGGLWPGLWMMGNLARATYVASSQHMWPFSFERCRRADQLRQEVNGCAPRPHYGLNAAQGRGAPEIDLLEVMPGDGWLPWGLKKPYYSTSLQLAPAAPVRPFNGAKPQKGTWYEGMRYGPNTSMNVFFYGMELDHGTPEETYWADAVSANTPIGASEFDAVHVYRLEWRPRGRIAWYKDGEFLYEIDQRSIERRTGGQVPAEPMYLLLNTAMSSTWGFPAPCPAGCACDCFDCKDEKCRCAISPGFCESLPASFLIDYVRVYQNRSDPRSSVGCDPASHPTRTFIRGHARRYQDPDAPGRAPLKAVKNGGARCSSDGDCSSDVDSPCVRGRCRCGPTRAGPSCLAPAGFDDVSPGDRRFWEMRPVAAPPQLLACALLAALVHLALWRRRLLLIKAERAVRRRAA